jgi:CRISPR-associated protein Cas2
VISSFRPTFRSDQIAFTILTGIAEVCEDHGLRVQYSLFECWLDEERFADLWRTLCLAIEKSQDRLVAYTLAAAAARRRITAGDRMICTEKRVDCFFG